MAPQTISISYTASEKANIRGVTYVRMGKLVEINLYFDIIEQISNNGHIIDFMTELPKPTGLYSTGVARSVNGGIALVSIERAHNNCITSWGATPVGTYYYAKLLYITSDE